MNNDEIIRLKPDEYVAKTTMDVYGPRSIRKKHEVLITKEGKNATIITSSTVDNGCEIEISFRKNGIGKVKYLSSTMRRKYYMFLKWYILLLQVLSIVFILYERVILGNYATGDARSRYLIGGIATFLTANILIFRNAKGAPVFKYFITTFSYFLLIIFTINFGLYLSALITG